MKTITLIPGDGIGPEIVDAVKTIFAAANVPVEWEERLAGKTAYEQTGELLPDSLLDSIRKHKIALKGPCETPVGKGFRSVNVGLRKAFELYVNRRPVETIPGIATRFEHVDLVLFRENLEGLYAGLEFHDSRLQMSDAVMRISQTGSERIVRAAFEYAQANGRRKVTLLHKANILKEAHGLFLRAGRKVSEDYPNIEFEDLIIDNGFMQLVARPEKYDVLVTTNMFGDILSDMLAGMVGGLGVVAGANIGEDAAIFEAVHGTAPDIAGKGIANPTGLLLSALDMLHHIGLHEHANTIHNALCKTLADPNLRTGDLGGPANTNKFAENVCNNLLAKPALAQV